MTGYARLLGAVHERGGRPAALRAIASSMLDVAPAEERPVLAARLDLVLAVLRGDIEEADVHAGTFLRLVRSSDVMVVQTDATRFALALALERDQTSRAAELALDYLDRRDVMRQARRPSGDATPLCIAVARAVGRLSIDECVAERRTWMERYSAVGGWTVFALAYGPAIEQAEALAEARARVPAGPFHSPSEIEARLNDPLLGAEAASVLLALDRTEEAADAARRAARSCNAPQDPFRSTHAHLRLAEALCGAPAAREEATRAANVVIERWGRLDLASVRAARALLERLMRSDYGE